MLGESIALPTGSTCFFPPVRNENHVEGVLINYSFHSEHTYKGCVEVIKTASSFTGIGVEGEGCKAGVILRRTVVTLRAKFSVSF